tara:strand:- start:178 stop:429 length:252 start_codon:yes stop_codon:yes gene_type:complete
MTKKEQTEHLLDLVSRNHPDFHQVDASIYYALEDMVNSVADLEELVQAYASAFKIQLAENIKLMDRVKQIEIAIEIQGYINGE